MTVPTERGGPAGDAWPDDDDGAGAGPDGARRAGEHAGRRRLGWWALALAGAVIGTVGLVLPLVLVHYPAPTSDDLGVLPWAPLFAAAVLIAVAALAVRRRGLATAGAAWAVVGGAALIVVDLAWVLRQVLHWRTLFQTAPQSKDDPYPLTVWTYSPGQGWWLLLAAAVVIGAAGVAALVDQRRAHRADRPDGAAVTAG